MRSMTLPAAVVAALATLTVLTGCSGPSEKHTDQTATPSSAEAAPANHNDQDVAFLQNMIPHHQQALDLTAMVPEHTGNAQIADLATKIADEQQPEIQAFRAQMLQWELPIAPGPEDHHQKMDGMVDTATMDKLNGLHGTEFDTLWLQSMIGHHQGAITMAQNEIEHGQSADTISMARSIVTTQQAEIDQMNQLLGG